MSDNPTIYDRIGGEEAVEAVVDRFYERVVADEQLAPFFEGVDLERLREHQAEFIAAAVGGPQEYDGADMRAAHAHLDLTADDFSAVAGHLDATLREFDVDDEDRKAIMETVESLEADVVGPAAAD